MSVHEGPSKRDEMAKGWRARCACGAASVLFHTDEMLAHRPGMSQLAGGTVRWGAP